MARGVFAACDDPAGATIAAVVVAGAQAAPAEEVRGAVAVAPGDVVAPTALAKLEDAVLATGWFESASVVIAQSEDSCVLRIRVVEYGAVREVAIEGATAMDAAVLREGLRTKAGEPANRLVAQQDAKTIDTRYQDAGFEAARVTGIDIEDGRVVFHVSEGRIARIEVRGARLTGAKRVRRMLGISAGDVYSSRALIEGQSALYRTGLFSAVGFGVEPLAPEPGVAEERLVLTVTVTEYRNPFSRTEVFAGQGDGADGEARGLSSTTVDVRLRNVGRGNAMRASLDVLSAAPDDLARSGFDEYYRLRGRGELALFRPDAASGGGLFALEGERVRGRARRDLGGVTLDEDAPAASAGIEVPVLATERVSGLGGFSASAGWRDVRVRGIFPSPLEGYAGAFGRGEIGVDLQEASGLADPASTLRVRAGLELHDGLEPFSFLAARGRLDRAVFPGHHVEITGDAAVLSGDVPFWRETPIGDREGPFAYGREIAFATRHARGRAEWVVTAPGDLAGAAAGVSAVAWTRRDGRADDAESAHLEIRLGPEFANLRAGAALPLAPGRVLLREPWFYAALTVASPY